MRRIIIGVLSLIAVSLFSGWLYLINHEVLPQFQATYRSFSMELPSLTMLAISTLPFWKAISGAVALVSLSIVFTNGKTQYMSILTPLFGGVLYLVALYLPVLNHGAVV